jgi:hypothetical protein
MAVTLGASGLQVCDLMCSLPDRDDWQLSPSILGLQEAQGNEKRLPRMLGVEKRVSDAHREKHLVGARCGEQEVSGRTECALYKPLMK